MYIKCDLGNIWEDHFSCKEQKNKAKKYCVKKYCRLLQVVSGTFQLVGLRSQRVLQYTVTCFSCLQSCALTHGSQNFFTYQYECASFSIRQKHKHHNLSIQRTEIERPFLATKNFIVIQYNFQISTTVSCCISNVQVCSFMCTIPQVHGIAPKTVLQA